MASEQTISSDVDSDWSSKVVSHRGSTRGSSHRGSRSVRPTTFHSSTGDIPYLDYRNGASCPAVAKSTSQNASPKITSHCLTTDSTRGSYISVDSTISTSHHDSPRGSSHSLSTDSMRGSRSHSVSTDSARGPSHTGSTCHIEDHDSTTNSLVSRTRNENCWGKGTPKTYLMRSMAEREYGSTEFQHDNSADIHQQKRVTVGNIVASLGTNVITTRPDPRPHCGSSQGTCITTNSLVLHPMRRNYGLTQYRHAAPAKPASEPKPGSGKRSHIMLGQPKNPDFVICNFCASIVHFTKESTGLTCPQCNRVTGICQHCYQTFPDKASADDHIKKVHPQGQLVMMKGKGAALENECKLAGKNIRHAWGQPFNSENYSKITTRNRSSTNLYLCLLCGASVGSLAGIQQHSLDHKNQANAEHVLLGEDSESTTATKGSFKIRPNIMLGKPNSPDFVICTFCASVVSFEKDTTGLTCPECNRLTGICQHCYQTFPDKRSADDHMRNLHPEKY